MCPVANGMWWPMNRPISDAALNFIARQSCSNTFFSRLAHMVSIWWRSRIEDQIPAFKKTRPFHMSPCRNWTKYTVLINILDMAPACCSQMFARPHATNILSVLESTLSYATIPRYLIFYFSSRSSEQSWEVSAVIGVHLTFKSWRLMGWRWEFETCKFQQLDRSVWSGGNKMKWTAGKRSLARQLYPPPKPRNKR